MSANSYLFGFDVHGYTCGVNSSGGVECWGAGSHGQANPPSGVFESVSAGGSHACGITSSGSIECWGDDTYGQVSGAP